MESISLTRALSEPLQTDNIDRILSKSASEPNNLGNIPNLELDPEPEIIFESVLSSTISDLLIDLKKQETDNIIEQDINEMINEVVSKAVGEAKKSVGFSKVVGEVNQQASKYENIDLSNNLDVRVTKIHVVSLLEASEKVLQGRSLTKNNIIRVAFALMHVASGFTNVKGVVKKYALLEVLDYIIRKDTSINQEEKDMLLTMVYGIVSQVIDDRYADGKQNPNLGCCTLL